MSEDYRRVSALAEPGKFHPPGADVKNLRRSAPVRSMRTVIHRDHTLTFNGVIYAVVQGGPGWGYSIHAPNGVVVADDFDLLAQVRDYVDQARHEGWDALGEDR